MLTTTELLAAEQKICFLTQQQRLSQELCDLQCGEVISKSSSIRKISPYLDEFGLLRLYGGIDEVSYLPLETRYLILMTKHHAITKLIVDHYHDRQHYHNAAVVMTEARQRLWVPHLKTVLKTVENECCKCLIQRLKPEPPLMGQLPVDPVTSYVRPFTHTEMDLFGPINVTIGCQEEKRLVAIFTCLTTRVAHIEIVENLSIRTVRTHNRIFRSKSNNLV